MKTTTVRLDDDQLILLEKLAKIDTCPTSEVVRHAIAAYITTRAERNDAFAEQVSAIGQQRMADSAEHIRNTLGTRALPGDDVPAAVPTQHNPTK